MRRWILAAVLIFTAFALEAPSDRARVSAHNDRARPYVGRVQERMDALVDE